MTAHRQQQVVILTERRDVTRTVLLVSSFGAFLAFLDATIVNVAFADLQRDFPRASYASLSWVLNAYNIVFAALLVTAGRFADLLGRRRTFIAGVAIFTLASAAIAFAPTLGWLIAARALQAIGSATLVPASLALVIDAFPVERRAHAIGLWGAAAALASGLGPPLGGALVDASGWRSTFLINLPLGAAALWASRTALVESRSPGRRTLPDLGGSLLLAVGLGALATALVQGHAWGWTSVRTTTFAAVAVVLLIGFGRRSAHHPSPVLEPALLRRPGFASALLLTAVAGTGFYAYLLTHVLWLTSVWVYSVTQAGLAGAPGALIAGVVSATLGKLVDRRGARVLVVPGSALWSSSFVWYLAMAGDNPDYLRVWLPGQLLSGLGIGLTLPVLGSAAVAAVPGGRYATASALASSVRQLGAVIGISLLVVVIGQPTRAEVPDALRRGWLMTACCFGLVAVCALVLRRPAAVDEDAADDLEVALPPRPCPPPGSAASEPVPFEATTTLGLLRAVPVFAALSAPALHRLALSVELVSLRAGEVLFVAGSPADCVYVVRSGRVEVLREGAVVDDVTCSGVVGELGLLTGEPRAATVRARRDSELLRVSARAFDDAVGSDAEAGRAMAASLARRLQAGDSAAPRKPNRPRLVAFATAGWSPQADAVTQQLAEEVARLSGAAFPGQVDPAALERLERENDLVVLVATREGAWRDRCLRQADRVVLVALSDDELPDAGTQGAELVLVGPSPGRAELDRWAAGLHATRVCAIEPADLGLQARSLADRLTGRSVGLVLSGGGARALAHLGVLMELRDAGVVIGRVAGCSMGAYIGALVAMGLTPEQVDARVFDEYVRRNPTGDWTLPRVALTSGRRGFAMLDRSFGDLDLEELPLPLVTSAVDLWTRELVLLSRGKVRDAVAGSLALPGISPPHVLGDRLLVDGGILDNSPVAPLLAGGEGPVLLSSIIEAPGVRRPGQERPAVMETVLRAMTTGSARATRQAQESATVLITPASRNVGLLEFHQIDRMVEAGRQAARSALAAAPPGLLPVEPLTAAVP